MEVVLHQLELNWTFFAQLGIFFIVFLALSEIFFKPFFRLFENRHAKTVQDRQASEKILKEAEEKLKEYQKILTETRASTRAEFDQIMSEAKAKEAKFLNEAREASKKITQDAAADVVAQKERLKKELSAEVGKLADQIVDRLMVK